MPRAPIYDEYTTSSDFQYVLIDKIRVPEKRSKSYNWKDGDAKKLLDAMEVAGRLVHPICVRHGGDDGMYELVVGQGRYKAAKKLGWDKILCKVEKWSENEIQMMVIMENNNRRHLTYAEEVKANQALFRAYEQLFGKDPGKSNNNAAVLVKQKRKGGRFVPGLVADDVSPDVATVAPSRDAASLDGGEGESQEPMTELPKAFSTMLAAETGKELRNTRDDARIAKAFTPEEMSILETRDPTKAELLTIAKIEDEVQRQQVKSLFASGMDIKEAMEFITSNPESTAKIKAEVKQAEMTDAEWLAFYCDKTRIGIQDTTAYDLDAIFYRRTRPDFRVFQGKVKGLATEIRNKRYTPAVHLAARVMFLEHPNDWYLCTGEFGCYGKNVDHPDCPECHGCGYQITHMKTWYKKKR